MNALRTVFTDHDSSLPVPLGAGGRFVIDADLAVFVVAAVEQLVDGNFLELADGVDQEGLEARGGLAVVAVGAAERLGDDLVDDAEARAGRGWSS